MLIKQDCVVDEIRLNSLLAKIGNTNFSINTQLVSNDIEKIRAKEYDKTKRDFREKEKYKRNAIHYLESLLNTPNKGILNITWQSIQNRVVSMPLELHRITEFKVLTTDYVNIEENEKMLYFDFSSIMKIIAFSIMHRDFDETFESLEEKLADIGIVTSYPDSIIFELIPDDILDLAKVYRISESPYMSESGNDISDYYLKKKFNAKYYREACDQSFNYTIELILTEVLAHLLKLGIKFKLCSVFDTGFYIIVPRDLEISIDSIFETPITVRIFGRKFEVENKLRIY